MARGVSVFCFDGCLVVHCESTGIPRGLGVCMDWQFPLQPAAVGNSFFCGGTPFLDVLNLVTIMVHPAEGYVVLYCREWAACWPVFFVQVFLTLTFGRRSRK